MAVCQDQSPPEVTDCEANVGLHQRLYGQPVKPLVEMGLEDALLLWYRMRKLDPGADMQVKWGKLVSDSYLSGFANSRKTERLYENGKDILWKPRRDGRIQYTDPTTLLDNLCGTIKLYPKGTDNPDWLDHGRDVALGYLVQAAIAHAWPRPISRYVISKLTGLTDDRQLEIQKALEAYHHQQQPEREDDEPITWRGNVIQKPMTDRDNLALFRKKTTKKPDNFKAWWPRETDRGYLAMRRIANSYPTWLEPLDFELIPQRLKDDLDDYVNLFNFESQDEADAYKRSRSPFYTIRSPNLAITRMAQGKGETRLTFDAQVFVPGKDSFLWWTHYKGES